jgi:hypothetical protein
MSATSQPVLYNYPAFQRRFFKEDMHFSGGPLPGTRAPDIDLPAVAGDNFRLQDYRGKQPVLIEFASLTCPMTAGARPALLNLFHDLSPTVKFVSIYVREAHPGEIYSHHTSDEQKMRYARDWVLQDRIPWTVAVDTVNGDVHNAYGAPANGAYLIDSTGTVAFRALWAGQEGLLRGRIAELLKLESMGYVPANFGQQESLLIPLIHGAAEFDHAVTRGGQQAVADYRNEMGGLRYNFEKLMSKIEPLINPENQDIE